MYADKFTGMSNKKKMLKDRRNFNIENSFMAAYTLEICNLRQEDTK